MKNIGGIAVYCVVCGKRKKPIGRSAPTALANSLCDHECSGYSQEPTVGSLWPEETERQMVPDCPELIAKYSEQIAGLSIEDAMISILHSEKGRINPSALRHELEKDAERYRWIREAHNHIRKEYPNGGLHLPSTMDLDENIDLAISTRKKK